MQVLCGLQVVFFLFNCQTPVDEMPKTISGKIRKAKLREESAKAAG